MDHRAPPPQQPELQLPSPVVRRRRSQRQRSPRQAVIPVVSPRQAAAVPVAPSAAPRQIPAPPAAAAGAADADADYLNLMLLAHIVVSHADAEAEAEASSRHIPAPAPAGEKRLRRYSPSLPPAAAAADEEKEEPYDVPPLRPLAVDEPQSSLSMGHGDAVATTKATAGHCKEAACPQGNAAGSSNGDQLGGGVGSSLPAAGAGASPMQLGDDDEELEPGKILPEKSAAGYNADPLAHGSSLLAGKEVEMVVEDEEAANTIAGEPSATGSSAHRAAPTLVMGREEGRAAAEISAENEKRKREVFVGGLNRDAMEHDVRAALSAAGQITQVRMFPDRFTGKNKGYCFVAYRDAAMASKAVAVFGNVKICGKPCRLAIPEGDEKPKIVQRDPIIEAYNRVYEQRQPSPTLAAHQSPYITSWDHHASYVAPPFVAGYYYPMNHNENIVYLPPPDLNQRGLLGSGPGSQMGQSGSSRPAWQPHGSRN